MTPNSTETLEFSDADLQKMDTALAMLEQIFSAKIISINTGVKKEGMPGEDSDFFDIEQWSKNEKIKEKLGTRATRLEKIADKIEQANKAILKKCGSNFL